MLRLGQAFGEFGNVLDVSPLATIDHSVVHICIGCIQSVVMRDRDTGRSRGFGFVTFGSGQEAEAAISGFIVNVLVLCLMLI